MMSRALWFAGMAIGGVALVAVVAVAAIRLGALTPSREEVEARFATPPSQFIEVDGARLHVRDEGQGPAILMIHSSQSNLRQYDGWAEGLKGRYRVIRMDFPPYGLSTDSTGVYSMARAVDLVGKLLDAKGVGQVTLVGSSSGATISTIFAATHPQRVKALALSSLPLNSPPLSTLTGNRAWQWIHKNLTPNWYPRAYWRSFLHGLYADDSKITDQVVDHFTYTNNMPDGYARVQTYLTTNGRDVWAKGAASYAAQVTAPVLLQWGDKSQILPAAAGDATAAAFTKTKVTLIHYDNFGHYPFLEVPQETLPDLKAFLDTVYAAPATLPASAPTP